MFKLSGILVVVAICVWTVEGTGCIGKCPSKVSSDAPVAFLPHEHCTMFCTCNFGKPVEMSCPADLHFAPKWNTCADPSTAECTGFKPDSLMKAPKINENELLLNEGCIGKCPFNELFRGIHYLPHKDCNRFCVCIAEQPKVLQCDPGEHWSVAYELCTHPAEAECRSRRDDCIGTCPVVDNPDESILLAHDDCKKYCHCQEGDPVIHECPADNHFSTANETCLPQEAAGCDRLDHYPTLLNPPKNVAVSDSDNLVCLGKCKIDQDPNNIVLHAHKECSKYCRCEADQAIERWCKQGLHFSLAYGGCVEPEVAKCIGMGGWVSPTSPPPTRLPPTRPPPSDAKGCIGKCPIHNSLNYTVHLPHKECSKFCKCNWGKPYVFECPDDLHFNPKEEVCDYVFNVNCTGIGSVINWVWKVHVAVEGRSINKENSLQTYGEWDSNKAEKIIQEENEEASPDDPAFVVEPFADSSGCIGTCPVHNSPDYTVQLAHTECRKFCKCNWGKPIVMECPDELHFNPKEEVCDYPFNVNCTGIGSIIDRQTIDNGFITNLYN